MEKITVIVFIVLLVATLLFGNSGSPSANQYHAESQNYMHADFR